MNEHELQKALCDAYAMLRESLDTSLMLSGKLERMQKRFLGRPDENDLQAKIDALMLEFCPERMTDKQIEEWEKHQVPCTDEEYNKVCRNLGLPTNGN